MNAANLDIQAALPTESIDDFTNSAEILTALEKARPQFKWK